MILNALRGGRLDSYIGQDYIYDLSSLDLLYPKMWVLKLLILMFHNKSKD